MIVTLINTVTICHAVSFTYWENVSVSCESSQEQEEGEEFL